VYDVLTLHLSNETVYDVMTLSRYEHLLCFADGMPVVTERHSISHAHEDKWLLKEYPAHLDMKIEERIGKDTWIRYAEVKCATKNRWDKVVEQHGRLFDLNGYGYESLTTIKKSRKVRKPLVGFTFFFVLLEESHDRIRTWIDDVHVGLHWMVKCLVDDRQYDVRMFHQEDCFIHWNDGRPTLEVSAWRRAKKLTENRDYLKV